MSVCHISLSWGYAVSHNKLWFLKFYYVLHPKGSLTHLTLLITLVASVNIIEHFSGLETRGNVPMFFVLQDHQYCCRSCQPTLNSFQSIKWVTKGLLLKWPHTGFSSFVTSFLRHINISVKQRTLIKAMSLKQAGIQVFSLSSLWQSSNYFFVVRILRWQEVVQIEVAPG